MTRLFNCTLRPFVLLPLLFILCASAMGQTSANGKCVKEKKVFAQIYTVTTNINATPAQIWALLTDASTLPEWNSTVNSLEGTVAEGEKVVLVAAIAPERTFSLKVRNVQENSSMQWKDGAMPMFRGVRTYTLTPKSDGTTDFTMSEKMKGLMFPMIKGSLPDFTQAFEDYASDLKKTAEQ